MPTVIYTALRELDDTVSPVHVVDTVYTFTFTARVYEPARTVRSTTHRSIGGQQETVGQSYDRVWIVQPTPVAEADIEAWDEFLHSVQYGEQFTFDFNDSSPLAGDVVILENNSWTFSRLDLIDYYQLSPLRFRIANV